MDSDEYTPPANFSCHSIGVYRSSFPARKNFSFLKALGLRSVLYLCPEEYPETNLKFCDENGITVMRFPMDGNKEPMNEVPEDIMHSALSALIDVRNHPILIHCNAGKHRTGCVSGCLRRLQGWALTSIFHEYNHFAGDKGRLADQLFLELYRPVVRVDPRFVAPWFDAHCGVTVVLDQSAVAAAHAAREAEAAAARAEAVAMQQQRYRLAAVAAAQHNHHNAHHHNVVPSDTANGVHSPNGLTTAAHQPAEEQQQQLGAHPSETATNAEVAAAVVPSPVDLATSIAT